MTPSHPNAKPRNPLQQRCVTPLRLKYNHLLRNKPFKEKEVSNQAIAEAVLVDTDKEMISRLDILLQSLAESQAREGILRDTLSINHEWHQENGTYPQDGCDDVSGLQQVNQASLGMQQDDLALRLVLQQRGDLVERIRHFNTLAGNTDKIFNPRQCALYTGLQCEELAEKFKTLGLTTPSELLSRYASEFKEGHLNWAFELSPDRVALADDDIDLLVVTLGSLLSQGVGIHGAFSEVHRANMAKIWPDGTMHRDANGKVVKPEGWTGPDLTPYVCKLATVDYECPEESTCVERCAEWAPCAHFEAKTQQANAE
jgi:predicted HAD superfamily Cof-like phosphohydrolase